MGRLTGTWWHRRLAEDGRTLEFTGQGRAVPHAGGRQSIRKIALRGDGRLDFTRGNGPAS